jgi:predicted CXXCH cytochrome family protein
MQPRRHEDTTKKSITSTLIVAGCALVVMSAQVGPAQNNFRADAATSDGYVGAQACASCHTRIHEAWTTGRHSKMIQPATSATVKGDFSLGAVTLHGSRYGLRTRNGEYFMTESALTGKEQEHRIDYTLGSRRIQHYLTTIDKGWIVVLAPSWDVQRREWFHNVEIVRPDEDDQQIVQQWNKSCVGCHVSGQTNAFDAATRRYQTRWTDFGTSCERCHGPGRGHVRQYSQPLPPSPGTPRGTEVKPTTPPSPGPGAGTEVADTAIVRPTRLDANTSSMVCAQCHSLRTMVSPGYQAGQNYYDFFVPALEYAPHTRPHASQDPPYWADGRPRRFSNDAMGLWQSACFLRGGATCTTCHVDPHLPDIERNPQLASRTSNALCTRCHQEIGARLTAHTRHGAGSAGSACVECHMPKTVISIKSTMRDHTIGVPAPENTVSFGIPNACTECHTNKPASWAVDTLKTWWPDGRRTRLIARAEAFSAARAGRTEAIDRLIAIGEDDRSAPLTRANALGYLGKYTDSRAIAALVRGAGANHPAIRVTAMSALGEAGRGDRASHAALRAALDDPQRAVRITALLALINQGGTDVTELDLQRFRRVSEELAEWTRVNQDDAQLQRAQGIAYLLGGDFTRAAHPLQASFDLQPEAPSVRFFLGMARFGQRRIEEARALLNQVPRTDPYYEKAQEQLRKLQ